MKKSIKTKRAISVVLSMLMLISLFTVFPTTVSASSNLSTYEVHFFRLTGEIWYLNSSPIPANGDFVGEFTFTITRPGAATVSGIPQARIDNLVYVSLYSSSTGKSVFAGVSTNHVPTRTVVASQRFTGDPTAIEVEGATRVVIW